MVNRPAAAVARLIIGVLMLFSCGALVTASTGNSQASVWICGAGAGTGVIMMLIGAYLVAAARRQGVGVPESGRDQNGGYR